MELRSDLLTSLRGKCEHEQVCSEVWNMVKRRDLSPLDAYNANSRQSYPLTSDKLNWWKHFTTNNGYMPYKGRVYVPQNSHTNFFMSVMIVQALGI